MVSILSVALQISEISLKETNQLEIISVLIDDILKYVCVCVYFILYAYQSQHI